MYKRFFASLLVVMLSSQALYAVTLTQLDGDRIAAKRASIEQNFKRNQWEKYAVYALAAAAAGGAVYYFRSAPSSDLQTIDKKEWALLMPFLQQTAQAQDTTRTDAKPAEPVAITPPIDGSVPSTSDHSIVRSVFNAGKSVARTVWNAGKDFTVWSAKTGWQGAISSFMLHQMISWTRFPERYTNPFKKLSEHIETSVQNAYNRVFFKPTLQWYISSSTHLRDGFKDLYVRAQVVQDHVLDRKLPQYADIIDVSVADKDEDAHVVRVAKELIPFHIEQFVSTWDTCIRDIEGVIGFLECKVVMNPEHAGRYQQARDAIYQLVETTRARIEHQCRNVTNEYDPVSGLADAIKDFSRLLQAECDSCIIAEHAYA